jgi:hypothetical protein
MRKHAAILAFAIVSAFGASARADRIHLPCDKPVAASVGSGIFTGNSDTDDFGDIKFERIQPLFARLELTLFSNCEPHTVVDGDLKPISTHDRVTRRWFGSLSFYGTITPETTTLSLHNEPKLIPVLDEDGNPVLDMDGNPVTKTENTLVRANLQAGTDVSGGFGARMSLIDAKHFHLEAYGEWAGSFGWNPARADTIVAHALELDIDVTKLAMDHASLSYRWDMENVGLTLGFPLQPNTASKNRLTPYLSLGYTWFNAEVDLDLDAKVTDDLTNLGVDVSKITQRRAIHKSSVTALIGARYDVNKVLSLESSMVFAKTEHTTIYWFSGSAIFRFDYPWNW